MSLRYIYGQDQLVADFVARMIPHCRRGFGKCRAIGVANGDNELIAGLVYHDLNPEVGIITMSVAALPGSGWMTRQTAALMYQFPFIQCGCQMILMTTPATNAHILRQLAAQNFKFIAVPRLYGREQDGVLCLLTYEDWMASKFCQRFKHHVIDTTTARKAA